MEDIKKGYGDTKIILSKRLTALENLELIWKIKSPAKIAESLTKIISLIKDLMQLSYRHDIEPKLHNNDALDKIYKLTGDRQMENGFQVLMMKTLKEKFSGNDILFS